MATPDSSATVIPNHDDPLSIQSSDHPGMKLVSHVFEGTGYGNWKRSMYIALSAKNKLGFIDGTQTQPSSNSATAKQWQRCNDMVFSWLLNALSSQIADSVLYCTSAHALWVELEDRYGQSNGAQLYAVHKKLSDFSQGTSLMQNPLPKISIVYNNPIQEERQRDIHNVTQFQMDSASFYAQNNRNRSGYSGKPPIGQKPSVSTNDSRRTFPTALECRFCKKLGHTIDKCFKLQNRGRRFAGNVQSDNSGSILGIYDADQHSQSVHNNQSIQHAQSSSQTDQVTHLSANFAGNSFSSISSDCLQSSWILYSGETNHMCANKSLFSSLTLIPKPYTISLPNGQIITIDSVGIVHVSPEITLADVLFVPSFRFNLLSVAKLAKQYNATVSFTPNACFLQDSSLKRHMILGKNHRDLYLMTSDFTQSAVNKDSPRHCDVQSVSSSVQSTVSNKVATWHHRLGHLPLYKLKLLGVCNDFHINENELNSCSICAKSRQHRLSFPISSTSSSTAFELVHIDVWGPYPTPTYNGYKYFLTIVDDFTRVTWTHLMSQKSNAFPLIKQFIALVKNQFSKPVKVIRTDNAFELGSGNSHTEFLLANGITHQTS
ncbi:hypothetical protein RND81_02G239600 [Saponaria officinalis]|uniref:Integrase catalytic domain-containing protein n=1 Tax=Saponaria officinalis TaxID=3572 RepID=A0AAW1MXX5_SAPOF